MNNQKEDFSGFDLNTLRIAKTDQPYLIDGDKEIMVAVKIVYR